MTQSRDGSHLESDSHDRDASDALERLRERIFQGHVGRGAVKKATEQSGAEHTPVLRAISPNTIQAIRELEEWLDSEDN
jgi:hypothetical protein